MQALYTEKNMATKIVEDENILIYFQPIVSVRNKTIIGMEALCRGVYNGRIIPPDNLFAKARSEGIIIDLDRLTRKKAIECFSHYGFKKKGLMLFLNFNASIIDKGVVGSGNLVSCIKEYNLDPNNVTIEINESKVNDIEALDYFVNLYKGYGFVIALDDVGAGHSNLSRLSVVKPDIIKIDKSLTSNVDKEFYKQEVLKSLINLSKRTGALSVAEGIENIEEAVTALGFGVDFLQGFYYSKPLNASSILNIEIQKRIEETAMLYKSFLLDKIKHEKHLYKEYEKIFENIIKYINKKSPDQFDTVLEEIIHKHAWVECLYILDNQGIQVSDTVFNYSRFARKEKPFFKPAPKGTDHSIKDYYLIINENETGRHISDPYISMASGRLCITLTESFFDDSGTRYILCIDISIG